ncbi:MAG: peptidase prolyl oligopeptidase active site domain protein [Gemmatimonadales bacterium]|nr:peptidase prolyl oligopeptidase active site domain protein [Gemmatimonadales bacterium]
MTVNREATSPTAPVSRAEAPPHYRDFVPGQRFQPGLALSPDGTHVAYSSNASGQFDLWVHPLTGGAARRLTHHTGQAVRQIAWAPDSASLVFTADTAGDEQFQIYRIPADGGPTQPITRAPGQHELTCSPFDPEGRRLVYTANDRDPAVQDVIIHDLDTGERQRHAPPEGVMHMRCLVSPDGRWLVVAGMRSNSEVDCRILDLSAPGAALTSVTENLEGGYFWPNCWADDSAGFYLTTTHWGEFLAAAYLRLDDASIHPVATPDWDIEQIATSGDTLLWSVNQAGTSLLQASRGEHEITLPHLPRCVINAMDLASDASLAVLQLDAATRPAEIGVMDLRAGTFRYLTDTRPPALHTIRPVEPDTIQFTARDGRNVHALLYRPHGDGPFPAVMSIHGGPEAQERPEYLRSGLYQYLLAHGVAVFAPNVAGSTGYGFAFQTSIYRDWGGIDLRDLEDAVTHLAALEWIDSSRLGVMGGSYGGFATLSCLSRIPRPWAAGVSICGPSNLVTLSRACPPTWRHFVNATLGDPDKDADLLSSRSPVNHVENITAPLFVIQGAQDPRVPKAEADQIVERLRAQGVEVRYDLYDDEGHGFTNRDNEIDAHTDIAAFLTHHLQNGRPVPSPALPSE